MQKHDTWYWAAGHCAADDYELESYNLFEAGVMTLEELETSTPERTEFRFYTGDCAERDRIVAEFAHLNFSVGDEPARDWDLWWRERQQPVEVGKRLWVRPPWVEFAPPTPDSVVLELEAKTAFGTGEHDSTALTVQLMEAMDWKDVGLLDIGTGTGILAMFALKMGAREAVVTEIDPLTVPCIVENFERNGCGAPVGFLGFLDCLAPAARFDAVVCNMIRSEVWPLRADIERLVRPGGSLVLSGQLLAERHFIADEWFGAGRWTIADERISREWWAVRAVRTDKN